MQTKVLGVKIDDVSLKEVVDMVGKWLDRKNGPKKYYIVTPNPEFLVLAKQDVEFKKILNNADLSIPDGFGLRLTGKIKNTTTGTDLMDLLCKESKDLAFTIGLLGGKNGVAEKAKERLLKKYPGLEIVYTSSGGEVQSDGTSAEYDIPRVDILFVAFGQVKQEKWISNNKDRVDAKVFMGVGGAFDYLSGEVPRAPRFIRSLGLEWLFRLLIQPWRIKRQASLLKFVWLLLTSK